MSREDNFPRGGPDIRLNVVVDVTSVGLVGGGTNLHLGVVLEPDIHPLSHGVLFCLYRVDMLCLLNSLLQLGPGLRLGSSQNVPVNGLPRLRVVTGGIPALPAAVLPFPKIALPVGSAFCHVVPPPLQRHTLCIARKINAVWRKKNRRLGILTFFKHGLGAAFAGFAPGASGRVSWSYALP